MRVQPLNDPKELGGILSQLGQRPSLCLGIKEERGLYDSTCSIESGPDKCAIQTFLQQHFKDKHFLDHVRLLNAPISSEEAKG